uniref:Uncharacterized protein n=1 Tax=Sparus aurata TaxID=8175 RepID=A0A671W2T9_SPAAU
GFSSSADRSSTCFRCFRLDWIALPDDDNDATRSSRSSTQLFLCC